MKISATLSIFVDRNRAKAEQQLRRLAEDAPEGATVSLRVPDGSWPDWSAAQNLANHCRAARLTVTGSDPNTVARWLEALTGDPLTIGG